MGRALISARTAAVTALRGPLSFGSPAAGTMPFRSRGRRGTCARMRAFDAAMHHAAGRGEPRVGSDATPLVGARRPITPPVGAGAQRACFSGLMALSRRWPECRLLTFDAGRLDSLQVECFAGTATADSTDGVYLVGGVSRVSIF
jgi:hypothetical protein